MQVKTIEYLYYITIILITFWCHLFYKFLYRASGLLKTDLVVIFASKFLPQVYGSLLSIKTSTLKINKAF